MQTLFQNYIKLSELMASDNVKFEISDGKWLSLKLIANVWEIVL